MRSSNEPVPSPLDLFQQGVNCLTAAELIFHADRHEIVDAAVLNAVFAAQLLLKSALGVGNPEDFANLSIADLFSRLDAGAQAAILKCADPGDELLTAPQAHPLAEIRTWLEWHEFLEGPKGNADRAASLIKLTRSVELYLLGKEPGWAQRTPHRDSGPLARSVPLEP